MERGGVRIGIISDTHGLLRPGVFEVFSEVDHIVHAGDIGSTDILSELETLAPVTAVYGNTDGFDIRGKVPQIAHVDLEGLLVTVTHGDQFGMPTPATMAREFSDRDVLIFGHTHVAILELVDYTLTIMNPGSAGPARGDVPPTVGIMEYEPVLPPRARIVELPL
jgi:putative phosphoesterase